MLLVARAKGSRLTDSLCAIDAPPGAYLFAPFTFSFWGTPTISAHESAARTGELCGRGALGRLPSGGQVFSTDARLAPNAEGDIEQNWNGRIQMIIRESALARAGRPHDYRLLAMLLEDLASRCEVQMAQTSAERIGTQTRKMVAQLRREADEARAAAIAAFARDAASAPTAVDATVPFFYRPVGAYPVPAIGLIGPDASLASAAVAASPSSPSSSQALSASADDSVCVCIGDTHGDLVQLQSLWQELQRSMTVAQWARAHIVFLGDYVDRGRDSRGVLEFLCSLDRIAPPGQSHHFIAGNHDLALALFIGALPDHYGDAVLDLSASQARMNDHERKYIPPFRGSGHETMHLQGLRYGMMEIYSCHETFRSYGVDPAAPNRRDLLIAAMPARHRAFLRALPWCVDLTLPIGRVIAVHAGLVDRQPLQQQLDALAARDVVTDSRPIWLSGRDETWATVPAELLEPSASGSAAATTQRIFLVSGHHHSVHVAEPRVSPAGTSVTRAVIDSYGGIDGQPLSAILLPSCRIVEAPAASSK
jgi:hypothetical protein